MSVEVGQPVTAAATTQVTLCSYDEKERAIWFCLIKAQFAAASIKLQKLKYANALAILLKQVLWDILWTQMIPAMNQISRLTISKWFCWGSLARANGVLI
jgi:hypothetical protein